MNKPRVILFGASQRGLQVLKHACQHYEVIGFADNDHQKHGTQLAGLPVLAPKNLLSLDFDYIIVASMHSPMIVQQLRDLGVPSDQIKLMGETRVLPAYDPDSCRDLEPYTHIVCAIQKEPELYAEDTVCHAHILHAAMSGECDSAIRQLGERLEQCPDDPMLRDTIIRVAGIIGMSVQDESEAHSGTDAWYALANRWAEITKEPLQINHPLVSVIVPVYKVECYLSKCLDSLVRQTLANIEIILVDDGSPDNSARIVEGYRQAHPGKIKYFRKPNGGLGSARNFGVQRAVSNYIGFVDGDDYVDSSMYANLFDCIHLQRLQVSCGQYYYYPATGGITLGGGLLLDDHRIYHGREFLRNDHVMVVCNKLYSLALIQDRPFLSIWFEDTAWSPVVMSHADRIGYIPLPLYHYVQRTDSILSSQSDPRTLQGIEAIRYALQQSHPGERDVLLQFSVRWLVAAIKRSPQYTDHYKAELQSIKSEMLASSCAHDSSELIAELEEYA